MFNFAGSKARLNARGVDINRDFPKQFDDNVFGMSFEEMGRRRRSRMNTVAPFSQHIESRLSSLYFQVSQQYFNNCFSGHGEAV